MIKPSNRIFLSQHPQTPKTTVMISQSRKPYRRERRNSIKRKSAKIREAIYISSKEKGKERRQRCNQDVDSMLMEVNVNKYHSYRPKMNTRKYVYIILMVSIFFITSMSIEIHRRLIISSDSVTISNNIQSERKLTVVVQLVGAFGNQLSLVAMGVIIQSIAKQHGFTTSLHIKSQDENHVGLYDHLFYSEKNRDMYRRACKQCFPNLRNSMFLEGNEPSFYEYLNKHNTVLGPELAQEVQIARFPVRDTNSTLVLIENALKTVQDVWQQGELTLDSGQWNSTFKEGTVLGPYSFPMILTYTFPDWEMLGRFYDELMEYFQVDEECYKIQAYPDEVVYYYRNMKELKSPERPYHDELSFDSIVTNLLGHIKGGEKLAIVTHRRYTAWPLIQKMRARNVTVRAIATRSLLDDFFFLVSAKRELIGRGESTFFQWAALLNQKVQRVNAYFVDNGSKLKFRFMTADFPPFIENLELRKKVKFELYNI